MTRPRYLTKSRFKLGMECPTKLFYTGKREYPDNKLADSFLAALAEGGFQVGELAKLYHPGGHDVTTLDYEEAEAITNELLGQENVIIFEPAIRYKNLFIRVDVLVKTGNHIELIEVKAKSFDTDEESSFLTKKGTIRSGWEPYLYDVAFQTYVLENAIPGCNITPYLMLADKNAECPTDGLNQKFEITRDRNNRKGVKISNTINDNDLSASLLIKIPVREYVDMILGGYGTDAFNYTTFPKWVEQLAASYEKDEKIETPINAKKCSKCEFRCSEEDEQEGLKSGFKECWKTQLKWSDADFKEPNILEIWNFRKKNALLAQGKIKLSELEPDDLIPTPDDTRPGLSASERQYLQVEKVKQGDFSAFLDKERMKREMKSWTYPLHFIDFETTTVAIPFNKGRRPYEGVAFQFSHHTVQEDGTIEHAGQYLNPKRGIFPNYEFVRALKVELDKDQGTIFRYSPHENTYLNLIYRQLRADSEAPDDRDELCAFIKSITRSVAHSAEEWCGERSMVDQWELVKRYYYDPATHGSNSIKQVLPAILNSSEYLQQKYAQPIYGAEGGIKSLNFKDWKWIEMEADGTVADPYKQLPKMFQDVSGHDFKILSQEDELCNGGAALTAYARMQFETMTDYERNELSQALLKYCELDTFAMVMIYEGWRELVK